MSAQLVALIRKLLGELSDELELPPMDAVGPETPLFGEGGLVDSLGLVSLVTALEQAIEDELDATVSLADEKAMSESQSPYRTVGSLADYARRAIEAGG